MSAAAGKARALRSFLDAETGERIPSASAFSALCSGGLDYASDCRPSAWRLLLGVVDIKSEKSSWKEQTRKARASYIELVDVALSTINTDANEAQYRIKRNETLSRADAMLQETANDVHRTCSSFSFFSQAIPNERNPLSAIKSSRNLFTRLYELRPFTKSARRNVDRYSMDSTVGSSSKQTLDEEIPTEELRWEQLHRFVYIWAILNPLGYVQGMCEIAAVLLFVFASSSDPEEAKFAEADAFSAFSQLLLGASSLGDIFNALEDDPWLAANTSDSPNLSNVSHSHSSNGLTNVLSTLWERLWWLDPNLARHLTDEGVEPSFFAIKWISTLYAQIFDKADILPIFDFLFSSIPAPVVSQFSSSLSNLMETTVDLACAMVLSIGDRLSEATFTLCVSLLQHYECTDPAELIRSAQLIQEKRKAALFADAAIGDSPQGELRKSTRIPLKDRLKAAASSTPRAQPLPTPEFRIPPSFSTDSLSAFDSPDPLRSSTTAWFGRLSTLGDTDMAASLAKSASNLSASTLQWREAAPSTLSKWTSSAATLSNTLKTSTAKIGYRAPSPTADAPFSVPLNAADEMKTKKVGSLEAPAAINHRPLLLGTPTTNNGRRPSSSGSSSTSPSESRRSSLASLPSLPPTPVTSPGVRTSRSPAFGSLQYVNSGADGRHLRTSSLAAVVSPRSARQSETEDEIPLALASGASLVRKRRQASEPTDTASIPYYWNTPDNSFHNIDKTPSRPTSPADSEGEESMETLLTSPEPSPLKSAGARAINTNIHGARPYSPSEVNSPIKTMNFNVSLEDRPASMQTTRRDSVSSTGSGRKKRLASSRKPKNIQRNSVTSVHSFDEDAEGFANYAEVIDQYA